MVYLDCFLTNDVMLLCCTRSTKEWSYWRLI